MASRLLRRGMTRQRKDNKLIAAPPMQADQDTPNYRVRLEQVTDRYLKLLTNELVEQIIRHRYSDDGD
jgi:hypothetical protein